MLSCRHCNAINQRYLDDSFLFCADCGKLVVSPSGDQDFDNAPMPPDWSFLQIGSIVKVYEKTFTLLGRIRLQLRNDYKNFWYGVGQDLTHTWLMESFASIGVMDTTWVDYYGKANTLHAGGQIKPTKDFVVKGEFVEKCEIIHFQGEFTRWKLFAPGFFFIQAANNDSSLAVFTVNGTNIKYLTGHKTLIEVLEIQKMITWDAWK
jgi:hypothetical protein